LADSNILFSANGNANVLQINGNGLVLGANSNVNIGNGNVILYGNGSATFANGNIQLYANGAGILGNGNIQLNANGSAQFGNNNSNIQISNVGDLVAGGNANIVGNLRTGGNLSVTGNGNSSITGNIAFSGPNVSLGAVGNLKIANGSNLQYLQTDGNGNLSWNTPNSISSGSSNIVVNSGNIVITSNNGTNSNSVTFSSSGANFGANISANGNANISGDASITGNLSANGNVSFSGANVSLGNVANLHITGGSNGQVLTTNGNGNVAWSNVPVNVTSNITAVANGLPISVDNLGIVNGVLTFRIYQPTMVSTTFAPIWTVTSSNTKDAFSNQIANTVNFSNSNITVTITTGNFAPNASTDFIRFTASNSANVTLSGSNLVNAVGNSNIANLTFLGNSNTAFIGNFYLQTDPCVNVSFSLTTDNPAPFKLVSGSTQIFNTQPTPFSITISGSWANATPYYWLSNQSFSWTVSNVGTVASGNANVTLPSSTVDNLSNTGGLSGNSANYNSLAGNFVLSANYTGAGLHGAGTKSANANSTIAPAVAVFPAFYKVTSSNANPGFTVNDSHTSGNYSSGGNIIVPAVTSTTDWVWVAIKTTAALANASKFQIYITAFNAFSGNTSWDKIYNDVTIGTGSGNYQVLGYTNVQDTNTNTIKVNF